MMAAQDSRNVRLHPRRGGPLNAGGLPTIPELGDHKPSWMPKKRRTLPPQSGFHTQPRTTCERPKPRKIGRPRHDTWLPKTRHVDCHQPEIGRPETQDWLPTMRMVDFHECELDVRGCPIALTLGRPRMTTPSVVDAQDTHMGYHNSNVGVHANTWQSIMAAQSLHMAVHEALGGCPEQHVADHNAQDGCPRLGDVADHVSVVWPSRMA